MNDPMDYFVDRLKETTPEREPFTYIYIPEVFPRWYYDYMRDSLADAANFETAEFYPQRLFCSQLRPEVTAFFSHPRFGSAVRSFFGLDGEYTAMVRWTRDSKGYSLSPHVDASIKVATLLFYMPTSDNAGPWGTSLYKPKVVRSRPDGPWHYPRDDFDLIKTLPFAENSMFGLVRSDNSWHGVEPITSEIQRDMIFYTVNENEVPTS